MSVAISVVLGGWDVNLNNGQSGRGGMCIAADAPKVNIGNFCTSVV